MRVIGKVDSRSLVGDRLRLGTRHPRRGPRDGLRALLPIGPRRPVRHRRQWSGTGDLSRTRDATPRRDRTVVHGGLRDIGLGPVPPQLGSAPTARLIPARRTPHRPKCETRPTPQARRMGGRNAASVDANPAARRLSHRQCPAPGRPVRMRRGSPSEVGAVVRPAPILDLVPESLPPRSPWLRILSEPARRARRPCWRPASTGAGR